MIVCDCFNHGHKTCQCGAFKDGVLVGNATIRVPLMMTDGAPNGRKEFNMMTDAEKRTMRDSVRGMPLSKAKDLPIYDEFRGFWNGGMPANELQAICDGAVVEQREMTADEARVEATRDHMIAEMASAHRAPVNDNRPSSAPQHAREGRPMDQLSDSERAREQMIHDMADAHKQS